MGETNKPTVAGILDIVSGVLTLLFCICLIIAVYVLGSGIPGVPAFAQGVVGGLAAPTLIIGILALVGGVYALQRKMWGWALAGSIAAILACLPLGIAATVLLTQSKYEFE